jgi:hypothetical protein
LIKIQKNILPFQKLQSKPKPKTCQKSEFGEMKVLERWRIAEQQTQEKWKNGVQSSLKNPGYDIQSVV